MGDSSICERAKFGPTLDAWQSLDNVGHPSHFRRIYFLSPKSFQHSKGKNFTHLKCKNWIWQWSGMKLYIMHWIRHYYTLWKIFLAKSYNDILASRKINVFWRWSLCDVSFCATSGCYSGLMSIGIGCTWKTSPLYESKYASLNLFSELMRSYNYCICRVSPRSE